MSAIHNPMVLAMLGVLVAIALAYFAFVALRAPVLAEILMRRGYAAKGWTLPRLTLLMRAIGVGGTVLAIAALGIDISKIVR